MEDLKIKWALNKMPKGAKDPSDIMAAENLEEAYAFHKGLSGYEKTPLVLLSHMAGQLGVSEVWVKDESKRFGLNAFKILGAVFSAAKVLAESCGKSLADTNLKELAAETSGRQKTFYTATDGNHGRAVAYAASLLSQKAHVLMPEGSSSQRFESISALGAKVTIENLNYDDCVKKAAALAEKDPNGILMQDTAWQGYEKIPAFIMQGYGTMVKEALEQLKSEKRRTPTHVFLQAGVGSMAAAVQAALLYAFPENPPKVIIMECLAADCFYRSAISADGREEMVTGRLDSIMAGLCCGKASSLAFDILRNHAHAFVSCPDWVAAAGMRRLASPLGKDARIISGESGAVGLGLLAACAKEEYKKLREDIGLRQDSRVLLFSTEGATDLECWKGLVWDGHIQSF